MHFFKSTSCSSYWQKMWELLILPFFSDISLRCWRTDYFPIFTMITASLWSIAGLLLLLLPQWQQQQPSSSSSSSSSAPRCCCMHSGPLPNLIVSIQNVRLVLELQMRKMEKLSVFELVFISFVRFIHWKIGTC